MRGNFVITRGPKRVCLLAFPHEARRSHLSLCGRDTCTRADDVEAITEVFLKNNPVELVDPLKIGEKIKALEEELEDFEENVDVALSEYNAITTTQIPARAVACKSTSMVAQYQG